MLAGLLGACSTVVVDEPLFIGLVSDKSSDISGGTANSSFVNLIEPNFHKPFVVGRGGGCSSAGDKLMRLLSVVDSLARIVRSCLLVSVPSPRLNIEGDGPAWLAEAEFQMCGFRKPQMLPAAAIAIIPALDVVEPLLCGNFGELAIKAKSGSSKNIEAAISGHKVRLDSAIASYVAQ